MEKVTDNKIKLIPAKDLLDGEKSFAKKGMLEVAYKLSFYTFETFVQPFVTSDGQPKSKYRLNEEGCNKYPKLTNVEFEETILKEPCQYAINSLEYYHKLASKKGIL